ncbi:MAG: DUF1887 family protein [Chromatiaceae bacterium]|nr:DUF1887 family protein [Chromatiaceae bacterium]
MPEITPVPHLVLLIGSNPVPNAIAALCLSDDQTHLSLLNSWDSGEVAGRLKNWLVDHHNRDPARLELVALRTKGDEYRPAAIHEKVNDHCNKVWAVTAFWSGRQRVVHLHYTGGTKTMTVHAHSAVQASAERHQVAFHASYLNPDALCLVADPQPTLGLAQTERPIPQDIRLSLEDLLKLHGLKVAKPPVLEPICPDLALALLQDHAELGHTDWESWINEKLKPTTRRPKFIPYPGQLADDPDKGWHRIKVPIGKHLNSTQLAAAQLDQPPPGFTHFTTSQSALLTAANCLPVANLGGIATGLGFPSAKGYCEWLEGLWLESAVFKLLQDQAAHLRLHDLVMNLEPIRLEQSKEFEIDVIAIRGYRLFAISCTTDSTGEGILKQKLFEASIRARQMGGDEARTALVCCAEKPERIQAELEGEFDLKGKIRVFGQPQLAQLKGSLADWIQHA